MPCLPRGGHLVQTTKKSDSYTGFPPKTEDAAYDDDDNNDDDHETGSLTGNLTAFHARSRAMETQPIFDTFFRGASRWLCAGNGSRQMGIDQSRFIDECLVSERRRRDQTTRVVSFGDPNVLSVFHHQLSHLAEPHRHPAVDDILSRARTCTVRGIQKELFRGIHDNIKDTRGDAETRRCVGQLCEISNHDLGDLGDFSRKVEDLWENDDFHALLETNGVWIDDNDKEQLEELRRVCSPGYRFKEEDWRRYERSLGLHVPCETVLEMNESHTHFYDIHLGGCRGERRKWIHLFDDVDVVLYVLDLASHNEPLGTWTSRTRLQDSLAALENVARSPWFKNASLLLVLASIGASGPLVDVIADDNGRQSDLDAAVAHIHDVCRKMDQSHRPCRVTRCDVWDSAAVWDLVSPIVSGEFKVVREGKS